MDEIIKEAIERGYSELGIYYFDEEKKENSIPFHVKHRCCLDPLFWQALGKSRGWSTYACSWDSERPVCVKWCSTGHRETWLWKALHFHEINLTQGFEKAVEWLSVKE